MEELQHIEAIYKSQLNQGNLIINLNASSFEWLIEQARKVDKFQSLIDSQTKTLEFYADEKNYEVDVVNQWEPVRPVMKDKGQKARETLGEN